MNAERIIRYQAAIIQDDHILLVRQRNPTSGYEWWNVPGGGREEGESEKECVVREAKEETSLDVKVERLLIDGTSHPHSMYQRFKTYLCTPVGGEAQPGYGPEVADGWLIDVRWFDLRDASQLTLEAVNNDTAHAMLQRICRALGYD
jgi:8-oxo-dGTP pyrophosphatase MutT (NUDIX family)